ncbi:MAG: hypothetical protein ACLGI7_08925, partial [Gammaproteobacteria bacterium]
MSDPLQQLAERLPALAAELPRVLAASRFLREALQALADSGDDFDDFARHCRAGDTAARVDAALAGCDDRPAVMR